MVGGGATTAAEDIDQAAGGELLQQTSGRLRLFVRFAKGVRQTSIRVATDKGRGDLRQFGQVGTHLAGAQSTVQADAEGLGLGDGSPEGVDGLSRQRTSAAVRNGH